MTKLSPSRLPNWARHPIRVTLTGVTFPQPARTVDRDIIATMARAISPELPLTTRRDILVSLCLNRALDENVQGSRREVRRYLDVAATVAHLPLAWFDTLEVAP